jgi:hypothetical protein
MMWTPERLEHDWFIHLKELAHFRPKVLVDFSTYDTQINCHIGAIIVQHVLRKIYLYLQRRSSTGPSFIRTFFFDKRSRVRISARHPGEDSSLSKWGNTDYGELLLTTVQSQSGLTPYQNTFKETKTTFIICKRWANCMYLNGGTWWAHSAQTQWMVHTFAHILDITLCDCLGTVRDRLYT